MKHIITTLLLCYLLLYNNNSIAQTVNNEYTKKYTVEELKEDFSILKQNLEITNPMLYAYTSKEEMDNAFTEIEKSINQPMTSIEFYRKISVLHQYIQNCHTNFQVPPAYLDAVTNELPRFPFEVYWDNDSLYILENYSSIKKIKDGANIKSINGEQAEAVFKELINLTKRDGYNTTFPELLIMRNFSRVYAFFKGTPPSFQLEISDRDNKDQRIEVPAITLEEMNKNKLGRYNKEDKPWYETKEPLLLFKIENGVAFMTIKIFQNAYLKYVGQRFNKFLDESFASIKREGVNKLILDLRNNFGGDEGNIYDLFSRVYDKPFMPYKNKIGSFRKIPNKKYYVERSFYNLMIPFQMRRMNKGHVGKMIHPNTENFYDGNIYVLTNGFTCSATAFLTSLFRNYDRATIIGEEPGGNKNQCTAGELKTLRLPHSKIEIAMWLSFRELNVDMKNDGHGVIPDYPITPGIEDVLHGKDVVMDFTLKLIEENKEEAHSMISK